jgi:hypothetical protein
LHIGVFFGNFANVIKPAAVFVAKRIMLQQVRVSKHLDFGVQQSGTLWSYPFEELYLGV